MRLDKKNYVFYISLAVLVLLSGGGFGRSPLGVSGQDQDAPSQAQGNETNANEETTDFVPAAIITRPTTENSKQIAFAESGDTEDETETPEPETTPEPEPTEAPSTENPETTATVTDSNPETTVTVVTPTSEAQPSETPATETTVTAETTPESTEAPTTQDSGETSTENPDPETTTERTRPTFPAKTTTEPLPPLPVDEGGLQTWTIVVLSILISFAIIFTGLYFLRRYLIRKRRDDQRRLLRSSSSAEGFFYGDGSGSITSNRFHDSI